MLTNKIVENTFFFGLLAAVAFLVWKILAPFAGALALAAIVVTISYPMHSAVLARIPGRASIAAFISVFLVLIIIVLPIGFIGTVLLNEARSIYSSVNSGSQETLETSLITIEETVQTYVPNFSLDITNHVSKLADFIASNIGSIFTGTATTIFLFFITLIATFYFFRDGREFTRVLIQISPLPDDEDEKIVQRLARSIRSVAVGTVLVALIQGTLTAIGLSIFGFERAVLWGSVAAIGALIPGVGTTIVFVPAIIFSLLTGSYLVAAGVALWGTLAVGIVDNIIGPYLMSRGGKLHPFMILLSVLGGIALFGPIGFILGPVSFTLFMVLLELYSLHISKAEQEEKQHG